MTPGNYTLIVPVGTTLRQVFTWDADGAPVDLSACSATLTVARSQADQPLLQATTAAGGGLTLGGAAGTITVGIDVPAGLHDAQVQWDLVITMANGDVVRLLADEAIITSTVPE